MSVSLVIDPLPIVIDELRLDHMPTITITAILHASQPITVLSWHNIFYLQLNQERANFVCQDLTSDQILHTELTKGPRRSGISMKKGSNDGKYYHTLEPETPAVFTAASVLASRVKHGDPVLVAGHRYRYGLREGEGIKWWWYGTKEEVLEGPGESAGYRQPSGDFIDFGIVEPVEFDVV